MVVLQTSVLSNGTLCLKRTLRSFASLRMTMNCDRARTQAGLKPGPYSCFLRELAKEADVVLEKDLDIVDAVLEHRQAVDADAEGEAADFPGVVIHEAVDGGIDHAGAEKLDPCGAFAFRAGATVRTAGSATKGAGDIELDARLGEWEIAGAEARFDAGTEELSYEILDRAGEIAKGDVRVDGEAFDLVKGEGVSGVRIVAAIDLSGNDDAHRRLLLFHGADLHGRSVGAKKERRLRAFRQLQIEGVHVVADRMEFGNVQSLEIVVGRFDFGAFDDREADGNEDVFDFLEDLANQVVRADGAMDAGEGKVDAFAGESGFLGTTLDSLALFFKFFIDIQPQLIELSSDVSFQRSRSSFKPVVSDHGEHAGLAAEP